MPALANFLNAEIVRRGWTKKEFAQAVKPYGISQSAAYLILAGDDNVQRKTQEALAAALDLTPADMAVQVYRAGELSADQVSASSAIERMRPEKRSLALEMLWNLAEPTPVPPAQPTLSTRRNDPTSTRKKAALRKRDESSLNHPEHGQSGSIPAYYEEAHPFASISRWFGLGRLELTPQH